MSPGWGRWRDDQEAGQSSVWALKEACLWPPGWCFCNCVETEYLCGLWAQIQHLNACEDLCVIVVKVGIAGASTCEGPVVCL